MKFWTIFVCLASTTSIALGLNFFDDDDDDFDRHFVDINPSGLELGSDSFNLNTFAFGQNYSLNLQKLQDIFHENFTLNTIDFDSNGQPILKPFHQQNDQKFHVYEDPSLGSILHVSKNSDDKTFQIEGILAEDIAIVPAGNRHKRNSHAVVRSNRKNFAKSSFAKLEALKAEFVPRDDLPESITIELVAILDYKNSKALKFDSEKIKKYLGIFWNAANKRFALFDKPKIQLSLLSAITIQTTDQQPFIEKGRVHYNGLNLIDYWKVWQVLAKDMYKKHHEKREFDIAMLMTAENLAGDLDDGQYDPAYLGISIVGGACDWDDENSVASNVGIAEDTAPFYSGVLYHAHEIAHLIGATHDGDEPAEHLEGSPSAESCPWSDGYLMSYKLGSNKHMRWSQCSVDQIQWFLKSGRAECLFSQQGGKPKIPLIAQLPGEIVGLDQQCSTVGKFGTVHHANQDKLAICEYLYCKERNGRISTSGPALEGTKCGYIGNKWCRNGQCVHRD